MSNNGRAGVLLYELLAISQWACLCQHTPRAPEPLSLGGFSLRSFCACPTFPSPFSKLVGSAVSTINDSRPLAASTPASYPYFLIPVRLVPNSPCPSYKTRITIRGTSRSSLIYYASVLYAKRSPHSRLPRICHPAVTQLPDQRQASHWCRTPSLDAGAIS